MCFCVGLTLPIVGSTPSQIKACSAPPLKAFWNFLFGLKKKRTEDTLLFLCGRDCSIKVTLHPFCPGVYTPCSPIFTGKSNPLRGQLGPSSGELAFWISDVDLTSFICGTTELGWRLSVNQRRSLRIIGKTPPPTPPTPLSHTGSQCSTCCPCRVPRRHKQHFPYRRTCLQAAIQPPLLAPGRL